MKINKFWKSWKNKTPQEKEYIKAVERSTKWIKEQSFFKKVISLYIKGSFVSRELNDKSDIDLVLIVKNNKSLKKIKEIRDKNKEFLSPVSILPISLQELKINKRYKKNELGGQPDHFVVLLPYHKLIYDRPINKKECKIRTDIEIYNSLKNSIINLFLPLYYKKQFGFSQLAKKFVHLVYWKEKVKGNNIPPTWNSIKKACPKDKLLQKTVYLRIHPTKNKIVRERYIKELVKYLKNKMKCQ